MSGTSVDSIDAALVAIKPSGDKLLLHYQQEYPKVLREEILRLIRDWNAPLEKITRLHYEIGEAFADCARNALVQAKKQKLSTKVVAIGSHGQTVFHNAQTKQTLQIGEAAIIAARTGHTVISDFRVADTAVGGEGAPLLPLYHQRLFAKEKGLAVHNLGGISNFTYLGPKKKIFALDTGPANCLADAAIQRLSQGKQNFDAHGSLAAKGKIRGEILAYLTKSPGVASFREKPLPKSTGRELFSNLLCEEVLKQFSSYPVEDILASLLEFSVELMSEAYERFVLKEKLPLTRVVFCGGGSKNPYLLGRFQLRFPKVKIQTLEDYSLSSQAVESQAFAFFAHQCLQKKPITLASTTGAQRPAICGKISFPPLKK